MPERESEQGWAGASVTEETAGKGRGSRPHHSCYSAAMLQESVVDFGEIRLAGPAVRGHPVLLIKSAETPHIYFLES